MVLNVAFLQDRAPSSGTHRPKLNGMTSEDLITGAGAVETGTAPAGCFVARLHATATCRYAVGVSPVAAATGPALAANQTELIYVEEGWSVASL